MHNEDFVLLFHQTHYKKKSKRVEKIYNYFREFDKHARSKVKIHNRSSSCYIIYLKEERDTELQISLCKELKYLYRKLSGVGSTKGQVKGMSNS